MHKLLPTLLAAGCVFGLANIAEAQSPSSSDARYVPTFLYPKQARPFGKSINGWADRSVQWIYAQPFDRNPLFDQTGEDCDVGQTGPVWYLPPIASSAPGMFSRACTIPRGKAVLLMAMIISDTYPCPDPNFEPAPGQSLYDFLVADSKTYPQLATLEVTLDGRPVRNAIDYKYISENLISLKGDPSLQAPFDSCITTDWQPAITNGTFFMFRPLSPGRHVIVRRSTGASGMVNQFTYYLTVR